jgi:hypothetical protein
MFQPENMRVMFYNSQNNQKKGYYMIYKQIFWSNKCYRNSTPLHAVLKQQGKQGNLNLKRMTAYEYISSCFYELFFNVYH